MNPVDYFCRLRIYKKNLKERRTRLHRVAFSWCQNVALADDLVQETLAKALKGLCQLRQPESMDRWLFDILTNCWRDYLRKTRRTEYFVDVDEIDDFIYEDEQEQREIVRRVRAAVSKLPVGQREVLALVDLEGFSYPEVADMLGIPLGTVTSRISRARNTLKRLLKEFDMNKQIKVIKLRKVI